MKLIKKLKLKLRVVFILIVLIYIIIIILNALGNKLVVYAKQEASNKAMNNINMIIDSEFIKTLDFTDIIENNKTIINTIKINKILKNANNKWNETINLNRVEKLFIPYNLLINDMFYNEKGKGFYIKSMVSNSYETDVYIDVEDFGLNNSVISIYLDVKVDIDILFPFYDLSEEVNSKILLTMMIVEGNVPDGIIYSN